MAPTSATRVIRSRPAAEVLTDDRAEGMTVTARCRRLPLAARVRTQRAIAMRTRTSRARPRPSRSIVRSGAGLLVGATTKRATTMTAGRPEAVRASRTTWTTSSLALALGAVPAIGRRAPEGRPASEQLRCVCVDVLVYRPSGSS